MTAADSMPDDVETLKTALIEARAKLSGAEAMIEHLQLVIAKMKREMFGPRSERSQRLIDQLELQLEELAAAAGEDETKAETTRVQVQGFTRTIEASGRSPSQRSSGNNDSVRGSAAPSSNTSIDLRHARSWLSLISPRYSRWRCTTRPSATRRFSTTLK